LVIYIYFYIFLLFFFLKLVDWLSVAVMIVFGMSRRMSTRFTGLKYLMIHLLMNTNIILNDLSHDLALIVPWGKFLQLTPYLSVIIKTVISVIVYLLILTNYVI
jgi:hypothetical protein